jgi:hypothetical protein
VDSVTKSGRILYLWVKKEKWKKGKRKRRKNEKVGEDALK